MSKLAFHKEHENTHRQLVEIVTTSSHFIRIALWLSWNDNLVFGTSMELDSTLAQIPTGPNITASR